MYLFICKYAPQINETRQNADVSKMEIKRQGGKRGDQIQLWKILEPSKIEQTGKDEYNTTRAASLSPALNC